MGVAKAIERPDTVCVGLVDIVGFAATGMAAERIAFDADRLDWGGWETGAPVKTAG